MGKDQKRSTLPARYEPGFLEEMDRRTEIYKKLREAYDEVVEDAGGELNLTHAKLCLCERFVFLEACLQTWETMIATNPAGTEQLLSRWIQGLNCLSGLAKTIGIERKAKKASDLKAYLKGRRA